jgi:hypothetical protein
VYATCSIPLSERRLHPSLPHAMSYIYIRRRGGNKRLAGTKEGRNGGLIMEGQEGQKMAE